jgi:transcriptional regulator with XRE-family HTH domain
MPSGITSPTTTMLGARIRRLRIELNYTQQELADEVGTQANRISDWEIGKHEPQLPQLRRLAAFYEITVADLLDGVM